MGKKKGGHPWAKVLQEHALGVQEASGVARLPSGDLLVVDDERGVFRCPIGAEPHSLPAGRGLDDLEGVCVASDGSTAWLLSERDGGVWRHPVEGGDLGEGTRVGTLPQVGSRKNRGWEGIAYAAANLIGPAPALVAVHQRKPRVIGVFDPETLKPQRIAHLSKRTRKTLGDLNDIAVNPSTGHLVVVSGKAGLLAELHLEGEDLEELRYFRVAHDKSDVPEGVTYDGEGRLWLVTDGEGWVRELQLG